MLVHKIKKQKIYISAAAANIMGRQHNYVQTDNIDAQYLSESSAKARAL